MSRLISELAQVIEEQTRSLALSLPDQDAELRRVFHGPPSEYLRELFDVLTEDGGIDCVLGNGQRVVCPVLLPVDTLTGEQKNPEVGRSGVCSRDFILALRNTPQGKRWIALAAPGAHDAKSVTGATDEFGIRSENNSGAASISEWMHDRFVGRLIDSAVRRHHWRGEGEERAARLLMERAIHAASEADRHDPARPSAWALLARAFEVGSLDLPLTAQWSLACGVPHCSDGSLNHELQLGVLDEIVDVILSEGFGACAERLKARASDGEAIAVDELMSHLRFSAEVAIALERAVQHHFAPSNSRVLDEPPGWWKVLSAERLSELIGEDVVRAESLSIEVVNPLIRAGDGLPAVVEREVILAVRPPSADPGPVEVTVSREGLGRGRGREWNVSVSDREEIADDGVTTHAAPIRYVASASAYRSASVKVVVLDAYSPCVVVTSRTASKLSLPKKAKPGLTYDFECNLVLRGEGRHFLDLNVSRGAELADEAHGEDSTIVGADPLIAAIARPAEGGGGPWGMEIVASAECHYDVRISTPDGEDRTVRLFIACEDARVEGCRSEFERLIRLNRGGETARGTLEVQIDRQVRTCDLQAWLLDERHCERSFYPLVLAPDCQQAWAAPTWQDAAGTVLSRGQFIHDPRPRPDEMQPPEEFVNARREIARRIRGEDGHGLFEAAQIGQWMAKDEFAEIVDTYVSSYARWLENEPEAASWVDVLVVTDQEADGALSQEPIAVIVNPLHPLRLGWHALAQRTLFDSWRSSIPCPAASILDPDSVPDALSLPLRTANGALRRSLFLGTDSSSDYWAVLWNAQQVSSLATKGSRAPFDREFGVQIGGVASGFSISQVQRAMDDVALLFAAKPSLNVLVTSATANGSACNDGLMTWARDLFGENPERESRLPRMGGRLLQVFDERRPSARPEDAEIANLAEDTLGSVKWFAGTPRRLRPDLGIIAQLETSNSSTLETEIASPLGRGGLLRHRVRTQLSAGKGAFLSESRMGVAGPPTGEALADHLASLIARVENLADKRLGYSFAPSIKTIQSVLNEKEAEYVAVSSSAVDPACFLGGWLEDAYLWDYELPAYSHRPGDTSGYYLLSKVRRLDSDALQQVLSRLPKCETLSSDQLQEILLEVARRGIPTVRGLSAGHTGASGDLGLFLAGRLLQDAFRTTRHEGGLLRIIKSDGGTHEIALVVPVDPFRGYLQDLARALGHSSLQRPDILVFGICITPSRTVCRLTPIEVKFRTETLDANGRREALSQARVLSDLLARLLEQGDGDKLTLWKLAGQHFLLSMLDFGFRVYSQREELRAESQLWSRMHQQVAASILSESAEIEVDPTGRLLVFDATPTSTPFDIDQDEAIETIVISPADASEIILDPRSELFETLRAAVGDWRLLPVSVERVEESEAARRSTDEGEDQSSNVAGAQPSALAQGEPAESQIEAAGRASADGDTGELSHELADTRPEQAHDVRQKDPATMNPESAASMVGEEGKTLHAPTTELGVKREDKEVTLSRESLSVSPALAPPSADKRGVVVRIGRSVDGLKVEEKVFLPSMTDLNQLNIGVVGDLGTGKTQLIKSLVCQIRKSESANDGVSPRFLIFDYKRDYQSPDFVAAVNARVVQPYQLPLNLFDTTGVTRRPAWMPRFQFFADVLDKIYSNIGPKQRNSLSRAVKEAHEAAIRMGRAATIYDVEQQYENIVGGNIDAPLSIIKDMTMSELFTHEPVTSASLDEFFDGVVVISLADLGQDDRTKNLVVAIFLNLFYEFMLRLPKRKYRGDEPQLRTIDSYLLVDEADNIMKYEFDVLKTILLQGREFGVGVLLASQYLRHFKVGATDYREPLLTWFIHKVPDVKPLELGALGLTRDLAHLTERIKQLPKHHCLYKTADVPGAFVEGLPFYKLLAEP